MTGRYFIATKLQQRVNQSVRSSFDRWCFNARFLRTDSSIVFRAMAAFAQRHLRAALNAWLEMIAQRRRIARALARWRRRECVAVLSALSFAVVCHRRKLRAARALLSRELHRAWNAWGVWLAGARESASSCTGGGLKAQHTPAAASASARAKCEPRGMGPVYTRVHSSDGANPRKEA